MELGLCASCYNDRSLEELCKTVNMMGIKSIELGSGGYLGKKHCDPALLLSNNDALVKFKDTIKKGCLDISALSCHGNPVHPDKRIASEHATDLKNSIELAAKLGVRTVNCFSGCPGAGKDAIYPNWIGYSFPPYYRDYLSWQWEEKVLPFWRQMADRAKKAGIKFGFELMVPNIVYNTETFLKLRNEIGADEISWSVDPAHLFWQGMNPVEIIKKLSNTVVTVHAIDCKIKKTMVLLNGVNESKSFENIKDRSWEYRIAGYGHAEDFWKDFISILRSVGFEGPISIEINDSFVSIDEGIIKAVDFLNKIIFHEKSS